MWLAGVHDIGKATPAFACQVDQLADLMREQGLEMRSARALGPDRRVAPHGLAGQALLGEWLKERHGWTVKQTGQVTVVVGGHHGVPPEHGHIAALHKHGHLLRTPGPSRAAWHRVQDELLGAYRVPVVVPSATLPEGRPPGRLAVGAVGRRTQDCGELRSRACLLGAGVWVARR